MKRSFLRRYRRPPASPAKDAGIFKKETSEPAFFGNTAHDTFFQPATINNVTVQRKCDHCKQEKAQRMPEKEEDRKLQKKEAGGLTPAVPATNYISQLGGKGQSLPRATQHFFGSRMGHDFSNVKIHADKEAAQSAKALHAKAYAINNHIVFNEGAYNTSSAEGKKLLAHELTHVVQQKKGVARQIQRAKIDYRQLTWADFKGGVPKSPYDAETASDIEYPKWTDLKTTFPVTPSTEECTETKNGKEVSTPKTEVQVKLDTSKLKIRPFMDQGKSWAKPVFKTAAGMKQACTTETADGVKECKAFFATSKKENEEACKSTATDCETAVKESGSHTDFDIEAKDKNGCKKIKDACLKEKNSRLEYSVGGTAFSEPKECSTSYIAACVPLKQAAADSLLKHEQGHFDITNIIARQLQTDVKALVDGFSGATFSECKKADALKKAKEEVKNVLQPQIDALVTAAKEKVETAKADLQSTQDRYDDETAHSQIKAGQDRWDTSLGGGAISPAP